MDIHVYVNIHLEVGLGKLQPVETNLGEFFMQERLPKKTSASMNMREVEGELTVLWLMDKSGAARFVALQMLLDPGRLYA